MARRRLIVSSAALAAVAAGAAAAISLTSGHAPRPGFTDSAIGAPAAGSLVVEPKRGVTIGATATGVVARNAGATLTLRALGAGNAAWQRHEQGAQRPTPFGREVVAFGLPVSEEFLVVDAHQGKRTWAWRIGGGVTPRLEGGSVRFADAAGKDPGLRLQPARVFDTHGRDVTPAGSAWRLARDARGWKLELGLNDASLPMPYVIDPAITFVASAVTTVSNKSAFTSGGGQTQVAVPAGTASGDLMILSVAVRNNQALTVPAGWTAIGSVQTNTAAIEMGVWYKVAGSSEAAFNVTWSTNSDAGAIVTSYRGSWSGTPTIDSGTWATGDSTSAATNTVTSGYSNELLYGMYAASGTSTGFAALGLPSGMTTRGASTASTSAKASTVTVMSADITQVTKGLSSSYASAISGSGTTVWLAGLIGIRQSDTTVPTGGAIQANGSASASYSTTGVVGITSTAYADSDSGIASEAYTRSNASTLAANACTPSSPTGSNSVTISPPANDPTTLASGCYTWTLTGTDNAGNSASVTSAVVKVDRSAPTVSISSPATGAKVNTGSATFSGTAADGETGIATVALKLQRSSDSKWWDGAAWQTSSATTFTSSNSTSWSGTGPSAANLGEGITYTLSAVATDAAGNSTTSSSVTFSYDATAPTVSDIALSGNPATVVLGQKSVGSSAATAKVFYKQSLGASGGSPAGFQIAVSASDSGGSGLGTASFPALTGTAGGWTHTAQSGIAFSSGTATSTNAFQSTGASETGTPQEAVAVPDLAGNSATATLAWVSDGTAPSGGSITIAGVTADASAPSQTTTVLSAGYSIGARTNFAETASATESGVDASSLTLVRTSAALDSGNNCQSFSGATTVGGTTDPGGESVGNCYRYTLSGSDLVGNAATARVITVKVVSPPTKLALTAVPGSATAGTSFSITVQSQDANGNASPVSADTAVSLAVTTGTGGTLSGNTGTIASGSSSVTLTGVQYTKATSVKVTASRTSGDSLAASAESSAFTVAAASASVLVFSTQPAGATAGGAFSTQPVVQSQDAYGNASTVGLGASKSVTVGLLTGLGVLAGTTSYDIGTGAGNGSISGSGLRIDAAGSKTLRASASGLSSADSSAFTVAAGTVSTLAVTAVPGSATAATSFSVTVQSQDAYGNAAVVSQDTGVSLAVTTGTGGLLSGSTGTISNGASSMTLTGVQYTKAASVKLTASRSSGDSLGDSAESSAFTVGAGAASKLQLLMPGESAAPGTATGKTGTPTARTAGTAFSVTVNAVDANWNVVASATPTVAIGSSDANAGLPSNAVLVAGTGTFSVTLKTAGSATVTATDTAGTPLTASTSPSTTVNAGAAAKLQVLLPGETAAPGTTSGKTGTPSAQTAGSSFSATVNAVDANWNVVGSSTPTVAISSSDANAALPSAAALVAGTGSFSVIVKTAGSATVTATDSGAALTAGTSSSATVDAAAASKLQILLPGESAAPGTATGKTGTPTARTAGTAFSVTVSSVDANWNLVGTSRLISITSSDANAGLPAGGTLAGGTVTFSVTLKTAGSATVTATDTAGVGPLSAATSASATVNAGAASKLQILLPGETAAPGTATGKTGSPSARTAGSSFNATVNAVDASWNLVASATPTVSISSSDANAGLPPGAALVSGTGTFAVTLKTAGSATVSASDDGLSLSSSTSSSVTVNAAAAAKLQILLPGETAAPGTATGKTGSPSARTAGTSFSATVNAVDANWNVVGSATPTVAIASGDGAAVLPADAALVAGTGTFSVTLRTAGSATVTATDTAGSPLAASTSASATVNPAAASVLAFTTQPSGATAGSAFTTQPVVRTRDAYGNNSTVGLGTAKTVTVAILGGTGTLQGTTSYDIGTSAGNGSVTATGLRIDQAGSFTLGASATSLTQGATSSFSVAPGAASASTTTISAGAASLTADGTSHTTITVRAKDAFGNSLTAGGATVAIGTDHGTLTGTVTDHSDGTYTDELTSSSTAETATLTGTIGGSAITTTSPTVDFVLAAAHVSDVTSTTANAAYKQADTVNVRVTFSSAVDVTGSPRIRMDVNATPAYATYSSGSGSAVLDFTYTVGAGDTSSDLDYLSTTALALNGGTIKDSSTTNAAVLTLPTKGGAHSIAGQKAIVVDTTAPSGGAIEANGSATASFRTTTAASPVTRTSFTDANLSSNTVKRWKAAPASAGTCPAVPGGFAVDAASVTLSGGTDPATLTTNTCYFWQLVAADAAGNSATVNSAAVLVDTTAPSTPTLALSSSATGFAISGTTLYVKTGTATGSFTVTDSAPSADAESGIASYSFPAPGGSWDAPTGSGTARSYALNAAVSAAASQQVTTTNNAGTSSSAASFDVVVDGTAPTGGSVGANTFTTGTHYTSSTTVAVASTGFAETASASASGLASGSNAIQRWKAAPASAGVCPAASSFTLDAATVTPSGGNDPAILATNTCYFWRLSAADNVGNATSTDSGLILVDTTAPSTPSVAFSGLSSGNTFDDGAGTLWFRPSASGTFTVTASSSDGESGLESGNSGTTYSNLNSGTGSNFGVTQSGDHLDVTFTGATTGPITGQSAHSTNNAGTDSASASFTISADSAAPTGGAVQANGSGSASFRSTTAAAAVSVTSFADAGSGIKSSGGNVLDRYVGTASSGSCPAVTSGVAPSGSWALDQGGVTLSAGNDPATLVAGKCYVWSLRGTDNVGNSAVANSATVLVDTSAPSDPTLALATSSTGLYVSGTTLYVKAGTSSGSFTVTDTAPAADAQSGIASYSFPSLGGSWSAPTGSGTGRTYSLGGSATGAASNSLTAVNGAGTSSNAATFSVVVDNAGPSGLALSHANGPSAAVAHAVTLDAGTDASSGLASWILERAYASFTTGTTCDATAPSSGWSQVGGASPASPYGDDLTGQSNGCYWYRLTSTDNVGNASQATVSAPYALNQIGPTLLTDGSGAVEAGNAFQGGPGGAIYVQSGASGVFRVAVPADVFTSTQFQSAPASGLALPSTTVNGTGQAFTGSGDVLTVADTTGFLSTGSITVAGLTGTCSYTGTSGGTTFTGVSGCTGTATSTGAVAPVATITSASTNPGSLTGSYHVGPGYVWSGAYSGTHTITFTQSPGAQASSVSVIADAAAPTSTDDSASVSPNPRNAGAGAAVVTISTSDAGAGVRYVYTTTDGSAPTFNASTLAATGTTTRSTPVAGAVQVTLPTSDGSYTVKYRAVDRVGNAETAHASSAVVVDSTAPTDSIGVASSSPTLLGRPAARVSGTTVYYRGTSGTAGSVVLRDTVSDASSGPARATFSALGSTTTGFTFTGSTVTGSSPYDANAIGWADGSTSAPTVTVTGRDAAGNDAAGTTLTFASDTTAPSTTAGSATTPRSTGTTVTLTPSDAGSGVFQTYWTIDGTTPAVDAGGTPTGTTQTGTSVAIPASDGSYTVKWFSIDNLGNAESVHTGQTILVDTTAPAVTLSAVATPATSPLSVGGTASDTGGSSLASIAVVYCSGAGQTAGSGGCATPTAGFTAAGTGSPWSGSWSSLPADGTYTVFGRAVDGAGNTTYSAGQDIVIDSSAPTGGGLAVNAGTSASISATVAVSKTDYSDAQSGMASNALSRYVANPASGSCPAVPAGSGWSVDSASVTLSSGNDAATLLTGKCYYWRLVGTNGAGLASTLNSASVLVDTGHPSLTVTAPAASATVAGTLQLAASASDGDSAVASVRFEIAPSGGSYATILVDTSAPYAASLSTGPLAGYADGAYDVRTTATDVAGNTTVDTRAVTVSNPAPTASTASVNGTGTLLTIAMSKPLDAASVPPPRTFSVTVAGASRAVTSVAVAGSSVVLALSPAVESGQSPVSVAFTAPSSPPLRDSLGVVASSFTVSATNSSTVNSTPAPAPTPAPSLTGASINGATAMLTFDAALTGSPTLGAFQLSGAFGSTAPIGVSVAGSTVTLSFATGVKAGEAVSLSFAGGGLAAASGGTAVAGFSTTLQNQTVGFIGSAQGSVPAVGLSGSAGGTTSFALTGAYVNGATMTLAFSRSLGAATPPPSAFRIIGFKSGSQSPSSVAKSDSAITLALDTPVKAGETVLVSYQRPAAGAIVDATGSEAVPFAGAEATNTTVGAAVVPRPATARPEIVQISPNDGLTVPSITQIGILASRVVTWSDLSVRLPDGTQRGLEGGTGASISRPFATTAVGAYTITGTIDDGRTGAVDLVSHFTIYAPPVTTPAGSTGLPVPVVAPPVSRLAQAGDGGAVVASDGSMAMSWPPAAFREATVVKVAPVPVLAGTTTSAGVSSPTAFSIGTVAVEITAQRLADGTQLHAFDEPLDIEFPNAAPNVIPSVSTEGSTWRAVPQLTGATLPAGQPDGWYRDASGTVHILTRHLTFFGVLAVGAKGPLAGAVAAAPRFYLRGATRVMAILVTSTQKAKVTALVHLEDGKLLTFPTASVLPGRTILRKVVRAGTSGTGMLTVTFAGDDGKAIAQRQAIAVMSGTPARRTRPTVMLVNGADERTVLAPALPGYRFTRFASGPEAPALLASPATMADVAIIDLSASPVSQSARLGLVRTLRAVYPTLRIVVATSNKQLAASVLRFGADAVVAAPLTAEAVGPVLDRVTGR